MWLRLRGFVCLAAVLGAAASSAAETVTLQLDRTGVPMGHSVTVGATALGDDGKPLPGRMVLPFVDGRRWGSHEYTDAQGRANFLLPLPNPGRHDVQVLLQPTLSQPFSRWIWAGAPQDGQTVYLQRAFRVEKTPLTAYMEVAVDDACEIWLNGKRVGRTTGWTYSTIYDVRKHLVAGDNVLSISATNGSGPGGFILRLDLVGTDGDTVVQTDTAWPAWTEQPQGWPALASGGQPAADIGRADTALWSSMMKDWAELPDKDLLIAGRLMPEEGVRSKPSTVEVTRRAFTQRTAPGTLVCMQWEPWFTPGNNYWQTAQAVPVLGFYDSYNRDVMRQHILWFADLGVDFVMPDWSNHIWGKEHWNERPPSTNEIIHATTLFLEALADARADGIPVPAVVIMPGLSNGPPATMGAMNEQLAWLHENYLSNPRFNGLWQDFDGKPLVVILDCGVVAPKSPVPVDETHFTVRWMSTQLQLTGHEKLGYWSWMDGSLYPIPTYKDGKAEAITVTPAYFAENGWTGEKARGRRGGTTYIESFKAAFEHRPRVILLHQWNEYAGQPEGQGYGPNRDRYVDSYSVELSDDLEPVSLTAPGYRGDKGGWGFYYHNLTRALLDLYRGQAPDDTLLAVGSPARNAEISGPTLAVDWLAAGKAPMAYTVAIDGKTVAADVKANAREISLENLVPGPHTLTVTAAGAQTRYPLSYTEADVPLDTPHPVAVEVPFTLKGE